MKFHELKLPGSFLIELELKEDDRGFFARSFCEEEFAAHGLPIRFPQCNVSFNKNRGTLRGMHYSVEPNAESKIVRCIRGKVFDVLVDLRTDSPTYLKWVAFELTGENRKMLYIPPFIAHGYQTLEDDCELFYHMSTPYDSSCARGVRWNDPKVRIDWPISRPILSPKDNEYPDIS